jgi:hypothetical protein
MFGRPTVSTGVFWGAHMRVLNILALSYLALTVPAIAGSSSERPQQAGPPAGYGPAALPREQHVDSAPLVVRLKEKHADRLAGSYIEPEQNRLVFRLTGDEVVPPESHWIEGKRVEVVFETGAEHTFAELRDVMERERLIIERLLPGAHGRYIDERTGEIVIGVEPGQATVEDAQLTEVLGVPSRIEVEDRAVLNR